MSLHHCGFLYVAHGSSSFVFDSSRINSVYPVLFLLFTPLSPLLTLLRQVQLAKQKPNTLPFYRSETGHSLEMFGVPSPLYRDL
jgi:hypothetical protein